MGGETKSKPRHCLHGEQREVGTLSRPPAPALADLVIVILMHSKVHATAASGPCKNWLDMQNLSP
jgi:hypothetical protein